MPGKLGHDLDLFGHLEASDVSAHTVDHALRGYRGIRSDNDVSPDRLARSSIRNPHHCRLFDARKPHQGVLNLLGIDVEPRDDDQVLLPVYQEEIAVLVPVGHVAGPEPSVDENGGGLLLLAPVAAEDVRPADQDLPWIVFHLLALLVDDPDLHAG